MRRRAVIYIVLITLLMSLKSDKKDFYLENNFHSINFSIVDSSFNDLEFLTKKLANIDIVFLSEGIHRYKEDGDSKLTMIKFLHEKMGYDLLLMEYSFYDLYGLNNAISISGSFDDTLSKYLNKNMPNHIYNVYDYVYKRKVKGDVFDVGGIDIWLSGGRSLTSPFLFFPRNNTSYKDNKQLSFLYENIYTKGNTEIDSVKKVALRYLKKRTYNNSFFTSDSLNMLWKQIYDNQMVCLYYSNNIGKSNLNKFVFGNSIIDDYKKRDSMMYRNFEYLKELYPGRKIIIYASTVHCRKSTKPFLNQEKIGNDTKPLAQYISEKYENSYHIAWIYNKVAKNYKNKSYFHRSSNSIETYLFKNRYRSGFIDLHELSQQGDSVFTMYPIWRFKNKGNWTDAIDAVIYMDTARSINKYKDYGHYIDTTWYY